MGSIELRKKRSLIDPYFWGTYNREVIGMTELVPLRWVDEFLPSAEEKVAYFVLERWFIKDFSRNTLLGFTHGNDGCLGSLK